MQVEQIADNVKMMRSGYHPTSLPLATINALVDLVGEMRFKEIDSAPETGENYLGAIIQPDGSFGEPFICYWDIDEHHICLHQTEPRLHRPTHWISLKRLLNLAPIAALKEKL